MANPTMALPSKRIKDQRGRKFGRLTVISFEGLDAKSKAWWRCQCDCGGTIKVTTGELNRKGEGRHGVLSCGCLQIDKTKERFTKHGHATLKGTTSEYQAWCDMRQRCSNPNAQEYKRYGARGISVCPEWNNSFDAFLSDVGPRPGPEYSLDRIDPNGNYEPGNIRWATWKVQMRNQRRTTYVDYHGERIPLAEAAERAGLTKSAARYRYRKGRPIE